MKPRQLAAGVLVGGMLFTGSGAAFLGEMLDRGNDSLEQNGPKVNELKDNTIDVAKDLAPDSVFLPAAEVTTTTIQQGLQPSQ